jgi:hypothetical protein
MRRRKETPAVSAPDHRTGRCLVRELADGVGDQAPDGFPFVIVLGRKFIRCSAFQSLERNNVHASLFLAVTVLVLSRGKIFF